MSRCTLVRLVLAGLLALAVSPVPSSAQGSETEDSAGARDASIHRVVRLKYISTKQAQAILLPLLGGRTKLSMVSELNLISISARADRVREIEMVLAQADVPPEPGSEHPNRNVVLTGYFVGASESQAAKVPQHLEAVVTELRRYFPYANYELLETFAVRTQDGGRASLAGLMTNGADGPPARYETSISLGDIAETGTRRIVAIRDLNVEWSLPVRNATGGFNYEKPSLGASLDIPEGVTVVVGKSGTVGPHNGIFLLLRVEVVDP